MLSQSLRLVQWVWVVAAVVLLLLSVAAVVAASVGYNTGTAFGNMGYNFVDNRNTFLRTGKDNIRSGDPVVAVVYPVLAVCHQELAWAVDRMEVVQMVEARMEGRRLVVTVEAGPEA
jgi:hypothetical protein